MDEEENMSTWGDMANKIWALAKAPIFTMWVACTIFLFSPNSILTDLGLMQTIDDYRSITGLIWLASSSMLLVNFLMIGKEWWAERKNLKALEENRYDTLEMLSPGEKELLRKFVSHQGGTAFITDTVGIAMGDARGVSLRGQNIIFTFNQTVYGMDMLMSNGIHPWARKMLIENPDLLA